MINFDTQKEPPLETVNPNNALEKTTHIEMGIMNEEWVDQNWMNNQTVNWVYYSHNKIRSMIYNEQCHYFNRNTNSYP